MEEYKAIPDFPDYYISNYGNVISYRRSILEGKKMKPIKIQGGYLMVTIRNDERKKFTYVHHLVAECFLDHKPGGWEKVIDHIDNDKTNNREDNLRIISQRANTNFGFDKKKCRSRFRGVSPANNGTSWTAKIYIEGQLNYLGIYKSEEEASQAYQKALKELI